MIRQPLDSKTLPIPMSSNPHNPAKSPHTQGHPGPRHTVITVEMENSKKKRREKKKGGMEGR